MIRRPPRSTLFSLHDALPILLIDQEVAVVGERRKGGPAMAVDRCRASVAGRIEGQPSKETPRSEEHTSELQSQFNLVCRLLLEKKKKDTNKIKQKTQQQDVHF